MKLVRTFAKVYKGAFQLVALYFPSPYPYDVGDNNTLIIIIYLFFALMSI